MSDKRESGNSLGHEQELEIAKLLARRYRRSMEAGEVFEIKTELSHSFAYISSLLRKNNSEDEYLLEICVECERNEIQNPMDAYHLAVDAVDWVWSEFFESNHIFHYPNNWREYEMRNAHVLLRVEHLSPKLDALAADFLRAHGFTDQGLEIEDEETK